MYNWELQYIKIDVANKTMHVRIQDAEGTVHEDKRLAWDTYIGKRIITTLFSEFIETSAEAGREDTDEREQPIEGTIMHEKFAEQFACTLPLLP